MTDTGKKFDGGKVRMDLLPWDALWEVARVLTFGAEKYDAHNWRGGMKWSRLVGAAIRHLTAWAMGQGKDPETGLSHLSHAACCVLFLLAYEQTGSGTDDRYILPFTEKDWPEDE